MPRSPREEIPYSFEELYPVWAAATNTVTTIPTDTINYVQVSRGLGGSWGNPFTSSRYFKIEVEQDRNLYGYNVRILYEDKVFEVKHFSSHVDFKIYEHTRIRELSELESKVRREFMASFNGLLYEDDF